MEGSIEGNSDFNYIDIESINVDVNAVRQIPFDVANRENILAFKVSEDKLHIACGNVPDKLLIRELCFTCGMKIIPYIGDCSTIKYLIYEFYEKDNAEKALRTLNTENKHTDELVNMRKSVSIEGAPAVKLTNSIINQAILSHASDIHIEPFESGVKVRFRIDGVLQRIMDIPIEYYAMVIARIKVMAKMDITEKRVPQDGSLVIKYNNCSYDFRVSTLPIVYGEKVVIRVLYKQEKAMSLNALGFDEKSVSIIKNMLKCPNGIILITGPTGSGKSTTLFSILEQISSEDKNIITIEDPVEYMINGANQVNVNDKAGITFAKGLRSILRQDPDIIMIGEIRDKETAEIAVRAAITGHLVLSTLHTNDAPGSIIRLMDMGVPSYLLNDALIGVVAQRLVRKICLNCKYEYEPDMEELSYIKLKETKKLYRGTGCPVCHGSGYLGRTAIHEIMDINTAHKKIILNTSNTEELRQYCINNGMISMKKCGINLVESGVTTVNELMKATYNNLY